MKEKKKKINSIIIILIIIAIVVIAVVKIFQYSQEPYNKIMAISTNILRGYIDNAKTTEYNSNTTKDNSSITITTIKTTSEAIARAKTSGGYHNMKNAIKSEAGFHSISILQITSETAKMKNDDYEVTFKGTCSGYTDEYNTEYKKVKFDYILEVSKDADAYTGVSWGNLTLY